MNEATALSQLKHRATITQLGGKGIDKIIDLPGSDPGVFLPPMLKRTETLIHLRSGRDDQKTLMTLCHELGHFWSYATGRRTATYEQALQLLNSWTSSLASRVRNHDAVQALGLDPNARIPADVHAIALADSKREKPNPLTAEQKRSILNEETQAWHFGVELAAALRLDARLFVAEANAALRWYFERLETPIVEWAPTSPPDGISDEDRRYIKALTA